MTTMFTTMESPIGELMLTTDGSALTGVFMEEHRHGPESRDGWVRDDGHALLQNAARELREYFAGERRDFSVPLNADGTTFQKTVWAALLEIPYGGTMSYGELARRIGNAAASRAVGLANGRNPISIIVPCHRVIGSNGSLTGYGGGLERKQALLALEKRFSSNLLF
jgi:methylated-DNA-[protein]-cysteine S-methyltransferase